MSKQIYILGGKKYEFLFDIGESVILTSPHDVRGIVCTVVEHVIPLKMPQQVKVDLYIPSDRKIGATTRKPSYLIKVQSTECYIWATNNWVKPLCSH